MIYPNRHIGGNMTRIMIDTLYHLPKLEAWHIERFAKKHGIIITTKEDIEALAIKNNIRIKKI